MTHFLSGTLISRVLKIVFQMLKTFLVKIKILYDKHAGNPNTTGVLIHNFENFLISINKANSYNNL